MSETNHPKGNQDLFDLDISTPEGLKAAQKTLTRMRYLTRELEQTIKDVAKRNQEAQS